MSQPRFTKKRSESSLCLALMLVCLVGWVVLSTRFSSQAAAVASGACSTPGFLTAEFIYHFSNSGPVASGTLMAIITSTLTLNQGVLSLVIPSVVADAPSLG